MISWASSSLRCCPFEYNQWLDIQGRKTGTPFPFWTLSPPVFCSWHLLCTHGSRFRMCSQTMSGSCRRHPSILFIKLGSNVTANMQWLEFWELETLESLSTFETGTHLLGSTERCFKLQNNFRFTHTYWSHHEKAEKVSRVVWWVNHLSYLLAIPPPILSFVQNQRRSMSHLSWEDQHASTLGMSWLVFSKSQTIQGCYLIPNRHRTFVRRPWTCFTFSGANTSLRLARWGDIQRAKHCEDSWLCLASSLCLRVVCVRGEGQGWRKELETLRNQMDPKHQVVLNSSPSCRRANSGCLGSKVLMGAWALYHMPEGWPHADFCWGSWNGPGSLATVIWVTAQQHLGVNKITCSAAT